MSPAAVRIAALLGGFVLFGILAVLIAVLVSLEGTRSEIQTTRSGVVEAEQRFQRVTEQLDPFLDATAPLAKASADAADEVPALADDARRGVGAASFIAQTLQGADLGGSLAAARALADVAAPATVGLLAELDRPGPRARRDCDVRLRTRAASAPGQLGCLIAAVPDVRALLSSQRRVNRGSLATQRLTLTENRRSRALLEESLAIQREILKRARSLDDKTGGPAPGTAGAD